MRNADVDRVNPLVLLIYGVIIVGSLLRLEACVRFHPMDHLYSDMARHWENGARFFDPTRMGGIDPILYQLYLFLLRTITGDQRILVGMFTGVLSVSLPWVYYRAAREFRIPKNYCLVLWGVLTWLPSTFSVYSYFLNETLVLPMMGLGLWMSARHLRKGTLGTYLISVGCWTLAVMAKKTCLPLALLCIAYGWWAKSRKVPHAVLAVLLLSLLLAPNLVRSWNRLGFPAPLGCGWIPKLQHISYTTKIEFEWDGRTYRFSSPSCYIEPLAPLSDWKVATALTHSTFRTGISSENGERDWIASYERAASQDTQQKWFSRLKENVILFLFAQSWPESNEQTWIGRINLWQRWIWAPLILGVLMLNAFLFVHRVWHLIPVGTTILVLLLMFQNQYPMEGRYRKPVEPLIILNLIWIVANFNCVKSKVQDFPASLST